VLPTTPRGFLTPGSSYSRLSSSVYIRRRHLLQPRSSSTQRNALIPLSPAETASLVATGAPTGAQYAAYWGRTGRERYNSLLESCLVSFLGVFFSYFLSFVLGGFVATCLGCLFLFWGILSPEFKAYQRNWEFFGGRPLVDSVENGDYYRSSQQDDDPNDKAGLYSALLVAAISDACVVQDAADVNEYDLNDFTDYTMQTDELEKWTGQPYLLRVKISDLAGREMQVHARLSEEYTAGRLRPGLPVMAVLLSTERSFSRLAALTELYVPTANLWIGDYPYLDREGMENLLSTDDFMLESLQAEATVGTTINDERHTRDDYESLSSGPQANEWQGFSVDSSSSTRRVPNRRSTAIDDDDDDDDAYDYRDSRQDDLVPNRKR
jgi:hypothetical protein